jgi:uncharacterized protein YpuA (DUF1002 family)
MSLLLMIVVPFNASADSIETIKGKPEVGDVIVTLGGNLSKEQKFELLNYFNVIETEVPIVEVFIEDEYKYLGDFISKEKMGNKSMSSAKIEIMEEGYGVEVLTNNISWVSEAMYANALITAGVKDAKVVVSAPFSVTGTGALTGVLKAYESYEEVELVEENKEVANEEMVKTAELSDEIGKDEADELLTRIKDMVANKKYDSRDELEKDIRTLIDEMGLTMDEKTLQSLVDLYYKMSQMDIDWDQVGDQLNNLKDNVLDIVGEIDVNEKKEQAEGFFAKVVEFFSGIFESIGNLFENKDETSEVTK